jgi:hypothetical protein
VRLRYQTRDAGRSGIVLEAQGLRPGSARRRVFWWLLAIFASLQVADVVTTNLDLAVPGRWEANPFMALSQAHLGAFWWLPKIVVIGCLLAASVPLSRRRWPMVLVVSLYVVIVSGNLACLRSWPTLRGILGG